MYVSVLVTAKQDGPALQETLKVARKQLDALPERGELVAVFAHPRAEIHAVARANVDRWVDRVSFDEKSNKARALNSAILAARGDFIALTEAGAIPQSGWLQNLLDPMARPGNVWSGVGGPILPMFPPGGAPEWIRALLGHVRSSLLGPFQFLSSQGCEYPFENGLGPTPFATNCAYKTEVLRRHPLTEEALPELGIGLRTGADITLALTLMLQGNPLLYLPTARVTIPVPPRRFSYEYARAVYRLEGIARGRAFDGASPIAWDELRASQTKQNKQIGLWETQSKRRQQELFAIMHAAMLSHYSHA